MMKRRVVSLIAGAVLALPAAVAAPAQARTPEVRQTSTLKAPPTAVPQETRPVTSYARREAQAKDLENFAGGRKDDVIYISVGAVLLIILILLLI